MKASESRSFTHYFAPRGQLLRWLGWFGLVQVALASAISIRYFFISPFENELVASSFFALLMVLGHNATVILVCALPLALLVVLFPLRGLIVTCGIAAGSLYLVFLLIDTVVFAQYRFHINGAIWGLAFGGAGLEIFEFPWLMYVLAGLSVVGILLLEKFIGRVVGRFVERAPAGRLRYIAVPLVAALILGEKIVYAWADAAGYLPISQQVRYLPGYQPTQAKTYFHKWGLVDTSEVLSDTKSFKGGLSYPLAPLRCAPEHRYNVVVIVIDSWRFDAFSRDVTPNLWEFSQKASVWENHLSGGNATRPGIFSLFYGIPATYWQSALAERKGSALVDTLLQQGYEPAIFASAKLTSPEFDRTVFASVKGLRTSSPGNGAAERDRAITEEFMRYLEGKRNGKPFFGFLFYDAVHSSAFPADFPLKFKPSWEQVNYLELNNSFDPTPYFNRYRNSVNYVDTLIGSVLHSLEPRLADTIVVITADHGTEFNDNHKNYWGHASNYSRAQLHVPMIIRWPGRTPQLISRQTSHLDFAPTILREALGCTNPFKDYSVGSSMFAPAADRAVLLTSYSDDFAVRRGDFVARVSTKDGVELYHDDGNYDAIDDREKRAALLQAEISDLGRFYTTSPHTEEKMIASLSPAKSKRSSDGKWGVVR